MAEEENLSGQPERGKEQSIFPLTKEAVDKGLANVAEDPYLALLEETGTMSIQNRDLFRGLNAD
jgi:hypothetical protein